MPELPEVETVRRGLAPAMVGALILRVEQKRADLRFPFPERFPERLCGRRVLALRRRAKYLLCDLDDGAALIMHLGMSGSFRVEAGAMGATLAPCSGAGRGLHDHVAFDLSGGKRVVYNDPRRFGFMQIAAQDSLDDHPLFRSLGLEPLDGGLTGAAIASLFARRATSLKAALLDQRLIAGLGNIYVCEALHRAGLSPLRAAGSLARASGAPTARARRLAAAIHEVLEEALAAGGSSLRDHRQTDGSLGYFQHVFRAYGREARPCPRDGCADVIRRISQAGRSTFFCPTCQK